MRVLRFLNHNPLVPGELTALREQFPGLLSWRSSAYYPLWVLGWLAALLPLVVTITTDYTRLLAAMTVAILAANGVTTLRTVIIAARAMSRDFPPDRWEALINSGLNARQIVLGKWWAVVRHVWHWHLLTGLMRVGLALGIAQHVHASSFASSCRPDFEFMCYPDFFWGLNAPDPVFVPVQPALYKLLLASLVIVLGSGLMAGLAAALGMLGALLARRRPVPPPLIAVILYVSSANLVFGLVYEYSKPSYWTPFYFYGDYSYYRNPLYFINRNKLMLHGMVTALDSGLMLAARILAPYEPALINALVILVVAVISLGLCTGFTGICLQACQTRIMRGGGQPPPPVTLFPILQKCVMRTNSIIRSFRLWFPRRRSRSSWQRVALWAGFAAVLAAAWTPRCFPLHHTDGSRLWVLAGIVLSARAFILLGTLIIATRTVYQGIAWEVMVLTGLNARQIILGFWGNAFRKMWGYHVVLVPVMFGFVYGLYQYLTATPIGCGIPITSLERAFAHLTMTFRGPTTNSFSPNLFQNASLRIVLFLLAFALAEAALLSALGLLSALAAPRSRTTQIALAVTLRSGLILGCMVLIWFGDTLISPATWPKTDTTRTTQNLVYSENRNRVRLADTARITVSPLADGGLATTLLYANVPQPYSIQRKNLALTTGLGLYILLTALTLWAAQKIAIRRGALPPE